MTEVIGVEREALGCRRRSAVTACSEVQVRILGGGRRGQERDTLVVFNGATWDGNKAG